MGRSQISLHNNEGQLKLAFMSLHINENDDGQFQRLVCDWSIARIDVLYKRDDVTIGKGVMQEGHAIPDVGGIVPVPCRVKDTRIKTANKIF